MSENTVIKVSNISKNFKLPHEKTSSIKSLFVGLNKKKDKGYETQHALKDISFEIKKGEFFGIVGRNGSGKSTLLKILAGIYQPSGGKIETEGKIVPFIELGVGFNPELTGRENVYLNGALLGFTRNEIDAMYDDIVSFAELSRFMDQKLKNYSSGMQVRLAFSVATRAKADILIVDEVLAVGDANFQKKCYNYFKSLKLSDTTVVFVTHDMAAVRDYCDRAVLIEKGLVVHEGKPGGVADEYLKLFMDDDSDLVIRQKDRWGTGEVAFDNIKHKVSNEKISIEFDIVNRDKVDHDGIAIGIDFYKEDTIVGGNNTKYSEKYEKGISVKSGEKRHFKIEFSNILGNFNYSVNMNIKMANGNVVCDEIKNALQVTAPGQRYAKFFPVVVPAEFSDKTIH